MPDLSELAIAATGMVSPNNRVEISRNAKGQAQVSVRVTGDDPDQVLAQAQQLYNKACRDNPYLG